MAKQHDEKDWDRRGFLKCMAWVGTGAVWTMTSSVLKGQSIEQAARSGMAHHGMGAAGLRFVQISDSHIGFSKEANKDVTATLREAVSKIKAASEPPFIRPAHRGSHTSVETRGVRHSYYCSIHPKMTGQVVVA
jgi:Icc protein